jgi:hypothetical protein
MQQQQQQQGLGSSQHGPAASNGSSSGTSGASGLKRPHTPAVSAHQRAKHLKPPSSGKKSGNVAACMSARATAAAAAANGTGIGTRLIDLARRAGASTGIGMVGTGREAAAAAAAAAATGNPNAAAGIGTEMAETPGTTAADGTTTAEIGTAGAGGVSEIMTGVGGVSGTIAITGAAAAAERGVGAAAAVATAADGTLQRRCGTPMGTQMAEAGSRRQHDQAVPPPPAVHPCGTLETLEPSLHQALGKPPTAAAAAAAVQAAAGRRRGCRRAVRAAVQARGAAAGAAVQQAVQTCRPSQGLGGRRRWRGVLVVVGPQGPAVLQQTLAGTQGLLCAWLCQHSPVCSKAF